MLGTVVFLYGGLVFLERVRRKAKTRLPGMMTLVSLAITVAFLFGGIKADSNKLRRWRSVDCALCWRAPTLWLWLPRRGSALPCSGTLASPLSMSRSVRCSPRACRSSEWGLWQ